MQNIIRLATHNVGITDPLVDLIGDSHGNVGTPEERDRCQEGNGFDGESHGFAVDVCL